MDHPGIHEHRLRVVQGAAGQHRDPSGVDGGRRDSPGGEREGEQRHRRVFARGQQRPEQRVRRRPGHRAGGGEQGVGGPAHRGDHGHHLAVPGGLDGDRLRGAGIVVRPAQYRRTELEDGQGGLRRRAHVPGAIRARKVLDAGPGRGGCGGGEAACHVESPKVPPIRNPGESTPWVLVATTPKSGGRIIFTMDTRPSQELAPLAGMPLPAGCPGVVGPFPQPVSMSCCTGSVAPRAAPSSRCRGVSLPLRSPNPDRRRPACTGLRRKHQAPGSRRRPRGTRLLRAEGVEVLDCPDVKARGRDRRGGVHRFLERVHLNHLEFR